MVIVLIFTYLSYAVYGRSLVAVSDTDCVHSCIGKNDTNYQSCSTCNGYVACVNEKVYDRPCQTNGEGPLLLWDDLTKRCDHQSNTCDPSYITFTNSQGKPGAQSEALTSINMDSLSDRMISTSVFNLHLTFNSRPIKLFNRDDLPGVLFELEVLINTSTLLHHLINIT